jgi:dienelactone hydrolase
MVEKEILVRTADGEMTTFVVHPDGEGPFPVAVLYMDGAGIASNSSRTRADLRRTATTASLRTCSTALARATRLTSPKSRRREWAEPRPNE